MILARFTPIRSSAVLMMNSSMDSMKFCSPAGDARGDSGSQIQGNPNQEGHHNQRADQRVDMQDPGNQRPRCRVRPNGPVLADFSRNVTQDWYGKRHACHELPFPPLWSA